MKASQWKSAVYAMLRRTGVLAAVAAAFAAGYYVNGPRGGPHEAPTRAAETADAGTVWSCSMHPQIRAERPGLCPICGMDLIPVAAGAAGDDGPRTYTMSESARNLLRVQTSPVERRFVEAQIRMVGKVDFDETKLAYITAWVPGRLDRLYVDYTGVEVKAGDHMVYLYSPEILSAQQELRAAANAVATLSTGAPDSLKNTARTTLESARAKLRRWGLTDAQIDEAERKGALSDHITIYAPIGGTVIRREGTEGMYVETGGLIYTIADLRELWVKLEAYESDLPWLHYGQAVTFSTEAWPGEIFEGKIAFIDPVLDPATRTVKVRVNVANPDGKLKPEMFVRALVRAQVATRGRVMDPGLAGKWISPMHPQIVKDKPGPCDICGMPLVKAESLGYVSLTASEEDKPLVIPATAPLITGARAIVYVEQRGAETPTYEGREIVLGPRAGDFYQVTSGLREGEIVVTHGNFQIDSAVQILAKPSMMNPDLLLEAWASRQAGPIDLDVKDTLRAVHAAVHRLASDASGSAAEMFTQAVNAVPADRLPPEGRALWNELAMRLSNNAAEAAYAPAARRAELNAQNHSLAELAASAFGLDGEAEAASVPEALRGPLAALFDAALAVQRSLAADDVEAARHGAQAGLDALKALQENASDAGWRERAEQLRGPLAAIAGASMDPARQAFSNLSAILIGIVKSHGAPSGRTLFQVHCPMAMDNAGADWLQEDDRIRNPYYGAAMLNCGSVTERYAAPAQSEVRHGQH